MDALTRAFRCMLAWAATLLAVPFVFGETEAMVQFEIAEGTAARTLKQFARQARLSIVFDARSVEDVRTREVVGLLEPVEALRRLLAGTPLRFDQDQQTGAIAVNKAALAAGSAVHGASKEHNAPMKDLLASSNPIAPRTSKKRTLLTTVTALVAGLTAFGQSSPSSVAESETAADEVVELPTFEVTGLRASLASAAEIKQGNQQFVDSIVATDIDKLPDINAAYALSRIPGIQVAHTFAGLGGNGAVTIRGLNQISSTIDGREVTTPGGISGGGIGSGLRTFDYSQIPSAVIAGIDVYKTAAANQLDGGLGGLVDVRMHKPFDFAEGTHVATTIGTTYATLREKGGINYSAVVSLRNDKFGLLLSYGESDTPWREDAVNLGNPTPNATVTTGVPTALTPSSYQTGTSYGKFNTSGYNAVLQWKPSDSLQFYAGLNQNNWTNTQDSFQLGVSLPVAASVAGSGVMFPGSVTAIQRATFTSTSTSNGTAFGMYIRDLENESTTHSLGGRWTSGDLSVDFDLSHNENTYRFYNNGAYFQVGIPSVTIDLGGSIPSVSMTGASLQDRSIYQVRQVFNRLLPANGDSSTARIDANFRLKSRFLTSILAGFRYATTGSDNDNFGLFLGSYNIPVADRAANLPRWDGLVSPAPIQNLFSGFSEPQFQQFLVTGSASLARDPARLLQAYGAPSTVTPQNTGSLNPLSFFDIQESTTALYVMPKFATKIGSLPFDGNVGLRVVRTEEDLNGNQTINPGTPSQAIGPINIKTSYTDWLPSLNMRLALREDIFLRFAASKTISRPNFGSLSPSLTLNQNPLDPNLNSGAQGNPDLKPIRSTNFDLALEYYPGEGSVVYAALFQKDVKGFITGISEPKTFDGVTYLIRTSRNLNPATIKGAEIGFQTFFRFLPEPFDGFGVQANYTYVDSTTPIAVAGGGSTPSVNSPMTNLSKHSYNIVAMFEKGPFSTRLAYNWRDDFIVGVSYFVNAGLLNRTVEGYGNLSFSLNYSLTKNVQIAIQGVNLTDATRHQYWGSPEIPSDVYLDGRTLMSSVTVRF